MRFVKVDPLFGQIIASGECPDDEKLEPIDHEGLLVFAIEGAANEYRFDIETRQLVRTEEADVFALRRLLAAEGRAPTAEELAALGLG